MVLATHAVVGAATASLFPSHPVIGFAAALTSHFLIDAIPHWHYRVGSFVTDKSDRMKNDMKIDRGFFTDMVTIGGDALLGIALSLIVFYYGFHLSILLITLGAIAGILPNPLQFAYWKFRHQPLIALQRFHLWIHAQTNLDEKALWGTISQILLMVFAVMFVGTLRYFFLP